MAIDIMKEQIVTLTEATKLIPPINNKRVAISTVWRWCTKGIQGVHLEHVRLGRRIGTSVEAIGRFGNALAEASRNAQPIPPVLPDNWRLRRRPRVTPAMRRRQLEDADRILREHGIL